jgi:predicted phage-related endonuclease
MALSQEQLAAREGRLTASRISLLMSGDDAKPLMLWREMVGDPEFEPEDLSGVWAVQLGSHTESLNIAWYERIIGRPVTRQGEVVICQHADWAAATLDGWDAAIPAPIECKHVGGFEKRETVVARYQPQCHWQMIVTGAREVALSIIEGAREPVIEPVPWDADYAAELWRRAEDFMRHVWDLTPPVALPAATPPVAAVREADLSRSNAWVSAATDWLDNRLAAKAFGVAEKSLKALVEPDVKRAFGAGVECTRNRAGALSLKEIK